MTEKNAVASRPTLIHGRLIAVSEDGRRARVYDPFYVRSLAFPERLADDARANSGLYVSLRGDWMGDTFCVQEMSYRPGAELDRSDGADREFDIGPDGKIDWNIWPDEDQDVDVDAVIHSWRHA